MEWLYLGVVVLAGIFEHGRKLKMMRLAVSIVMIAVLCGGALAQATKPASAETIAAIELRAQTAFDKGDYATALPLFMNLEKKLADKPDKLGPIQEKIRVCKKNLLKDPPKDLQAFSESEAGRRGHAGKAQAARSAQGWSGVWTWPSRTWGILNMMRKRAGICRRM
jgi:hypothetical protein